MSIHYGSIAIIQRPHSTEAFIVEGEDDLPPLTQVVGVTTIHLSQPFSSPLTVLSKIQPILHLHPPELIISSAELHFEPYIPF